HDSKRLNAPAAYYRARLWFRLSRIPPLIQRTPYGKQEGAGQDLAILPSAFSVSRLQLSDSLRHLHFLVLGDRSQLVHDADVQLADALLGDAQLLTDFLERHALGVAVETGSHADDLPLARVEVLQQPIDAVGRLFGAGQAFLLVGAVVRGELEDLFL